MSKCVRNTSTGLIKRISNKEAEVLVGKGQHEYCSKSDFKRQENAIDKPKKKGDS